MGEDTVETPPEPSLEQSGDPLPGLSEADVEQLEARRTSLINALLSNPAGRALVRRSDEQIDQVGRQLADDIDALARTARTDGEGDVDPLRKHSAAVVLNDLVLLVHRAATHDLYHHRSKLYEKAQGAHTRMDDWMDHRIRSQAFAESTRRKLFIARFWGLLGNVLTVFAASSLLFFQSFQVAAVLIGLRILVTALIWSLAAYPGDDSPKKPVLDSDPLICVMGHAGDLLVFTSFSMALVDGGHTAAAFLIIAAGTIMLLGTIMRLAASATGFPVPRLHLERMVRGGSTFAAMCLAAVPSVAWWSPAIVLIFLPTVFAFIEGQEAKRAFALGKRTPYSSVTPASSQVVEPSSASASL